MKAEAMETVSVKIPPELSRMLGKYCVESGQTRSKAMRTLLERGLFERELSREIRQHHDLLRIELHTLFAAVIGNLPNAGAVDPEEAVQEILEYAASQVNLLPRRDARCQR